MQQVPNAARESNKETQTPLPVALNCLMLVNGIANRCDCQFPPNAGIHSDIIRAKKASKKTTKELVLTENADLYGFVRKHGPLPSSRHVTVSGFHRHLM